MCSSTVPSKIIVLSFDEVRPDHLGCYGDREIRTPSFDRAAAEGARLATCISCSDFTPIAMGSVLTGLYPNRHGIRDPYCRLGAPTVATFFKERGFATAGFVGNGLLDRAHGFAQGFDVWNEPSAETYWGTTDYGGEYDEPIYEGLDWRESFFSWLEAHHSESFFIWGHFYETHGYSEEWLLKRGLLPPDADREHGCYRAKIEMADRLVVDRLLTTLDRLNIADDTLVVLMSDHGTNLGEHPVERLPWRDREVIFPQHTTLYECDLRVMMILRGPGIPVGRVVEMPMGSFGLTPTLLELAQIPLPESRFDGRSWALLMREDEGDVESPIEIYSEDLFERRGKGALQSLRGRRFKYLRNLTQHSDEYYDLEKDPNEQENRVEELSEDRLCELRQKLNWKLISRGVSGGAMDSQQREDLRRQMAAMGYFS